MDQRTARQLAFTAVALFLLALLLAPGGRASDRSDRLADATAFFSHRRPTILCPTELAWTEDPLVSSQAAPERVLGYTRMFTDEIVLAPDVCEGSRGIADPRLRPDQRALGALVLVHEALHVRRWPNRWIEAKVECLAIRRFTLGAVLLGASPELAAELLPYAVAAHKRMGELSPQYADPGCRTP
ncbi:MAG TPA: hypothetical protein VFP31_03220 [Gaiellaceae bacterium]|nr:hypothetical protein [Gaiellaceae bacterium]